MIRGGCLCGAVRFEITQAVGPFELCHCSRCRKVSGSAFAAGLGIDRTAFRLLQGREAIRTFDAPILRSPPPYRTSFCGRCGSPVPDPTGDSPSLEVPAGSLDDDPGLRPDKHIFVEVKASWYTIADELPQLDLIALTKHRLASAQRGIEPRVD